MEKVAIVFLMLRGTMVLSYVYTRNKLRSLTRALCYNFEQCITANIENNPKAFWRHAKSRLKTQTKMHDIHDSDGNKIESDVSKGTAFNQFFTSVFTHEDCSNLPSFSVGHPVPYVTLMYQLLSFIISYDYYMVVNPLVLMIGLLSPSRKLLLKSLFHSQLSLLSHFYLVSYLIVGKQLMWYPFTNLVLGIFLIITDL